MTPYNRRHPRINGHISSLSISQDLIKDNSLTVLGLLAAVLDLNPHLVGTDLSDTQDRIARYGAKFLAREATDRLTTSENQEDKHVLHHYLNTKD